MMAEQEKMVKAIMIYVGGKKKVEVSIEDARKLHAALDELFGSRAEAPWVVPVPYPVWRHPYNWWITWSQSDTGSVVLSMTGGPDA